MALLRHYLGNSLSQIGVLEKGKGTLKTRTYWHLHEYILSPDHDLALAPLLSIVDATQRIGQRVHPHHGGSGYLLSAKTIRW